MMKSVSALRTLFTVAGLLLLLAAPVAAAIDCFSCHDREAFQQRVKHDPAADGDCLACHNPHVARFESLLQEQVKDLCYSCHEDASRQHAQGIVHQPVREGNCLGCHNPHASQQDGLLQDRLATTCLNCHKTMPKKYKYTHAPYAQGKCDACHQPHQSEQSYLLVSEADQLCRKCHATGTLQQKHRNFPAELANCGSCHNPHGSERPHLIRNVLHQPYSEGCSDCHEGKNSVVTIDKCLECHPEVSEQMASSHNHLVRYRENGCLACHSPHAGDDERLLKGKERHVCGTCHEATFQRYEQAKFKHVLTDACNNCHAPHGSNHPAMFKGAINDVCRDCHGKHGFFTHPIGENVFDPRTGQKLTCGSCHATKGSDHEYHTHYERKKALCVQCHAEY